MLARVAARGLQSAVQSFVVPVGVSLRIPEPRNLTKAVKHHVALRQPQIIHRIRQGQVPHVVVKDSLVLRRRQDGLAPPDILHHVEKLLPSRNQNDSILPNPCLVSAQLLHHEDTHAMRLSGLGFTTAV